MVTNSFIDIKIKFKTKNRLKVNHHIFLENLLQGIVYRLNQNSHTLNWS